MQKILKTFVWQIILNSCFHNVSRLTGLEHLGYENIHEPPWMRETANRDAIRVGVTTFAEILTKQQKTQLKYRFNVIGRNFIMCFFNVLKNYTRYSQETVSQIKALVTKNGICILQLIKHKFWGSKNGNKNNISSAEKVYFILHILSKTNCFQIWEETTKILNKWLIWES